RGALRRHQGQRLGQRRRHRDLRRLPEHEVRHAARLGRRTMAGVRSSVELLRRLVAFDTVSAKPNVALIDWAAQRLEDAGFRCLVQHGDESGKANLFATAGPDDVAGWMLSGHSDVVPVAGQAWSSDPFTLREDGGRLHARGAADMKGFLACVLDAAPRLAAAKLRAPVHVAFSYDE